jgi:hypothetical protein
MLCASVFYSLGLYDREAPNHQEEMKKAWIYYACMICLLCLASPAGYGDSMAADLDYEGMVEKADFILVGDVTRIHNVSFTYVTLEVEEYVTNPQNMSQVTLTIGYEAYDGVGGTVYTPHDLFYVGERVLVFVKKAGPYYRVLYGEAGKYSVREGAPHGGSTFKTVIGNWSTPVDFHPRLVYNESKQDLVSSGSTVDEVLTVAAAVLIFILLLAYLRWREKI